MTPGTSPRTHETFKAHAGFEVEILDLSRTTSEFGKTIHPCKSCVSTSMALCHWPCSCYPNYSLGQVHDWMNEIYPLWVAAHGILVVTPVNWYQAPGPLKAMMDRLGTEPVREWALRLWPWEGKDVFHGLVRIQVTPANGTPEMADRLSRWLLAQRAPLSTPHLRWDRLP